VNRAALNCWKENGRTVGVGFKAGVVGIGEVAPSGEWVTGGGSEGWVGIESKEVSVLSLDSVQVLKMNVDQNIGR
jgi:uncharacterized spore protein YtfJ